MALVVSVNTYGNMLTFRWDNGDCFTLNRTVTLFEHIRITDRSDGVFMEVKIAGEPVHRFKFDSKDSAWSAHDVIMFKNKSWSMSTEDKDEAKDKEPHHVSSDAKPEEPHQPRQPVVVGAMPGCAVCDEAHHQLNYDAMNLNDDMMKATPEDVVLLPVLAVAN